MKPPRDRLTTLNQISSVIARDNVTPLILISQAQYLLSLGNFILTGQWLVDKDGNNMVMKSHGPSDGGVGNLKMLSETSVGNADPVTVKYGSNFDVKDLEKFVDSKFLEAVIFKAQGRVGSNLALAELGAFNKVINEVLTIFKQNFPEYCKKDVASLEESNHLASLFAKIQIRDVQEATPDGVVYDSERQRAKSFDDSHVDGNKVRSDGYTSPSSNIVGKAKGRSLSFSVSPVSRNL